MITGDNPLTACHVAKELKISSKQLLVLKQIEEGVFLWENVSGSITHPLEIERLAIRQLGEMFDFCFTGDVRDSFYHSYPL